MRSYRPKHSYRGRPMLSHRRMHIGPMKFWRADTVRDAVAKCWLGDGAAKPFLRLAPFELRIQLVSAAGSWRLAMAVVRQLLRAGILELDVRATPAKPAKPDTRKHRSTIVARRGLSVDSRRD